MSKSIPTGRFARGSVAATTAAVVGAKKLTFITRKPFLSEKNLSEAQRAHDDDVAATIFNSLAKLRGTALKAGQILSLEAGLLPESYRRQLFKAHYQAPPLNRAVIRKLMSSEFGRQPNEVFAEFSDEAFAAASLGQVHRGVLHEGGEVAVKIQYPGVGGTISGDLQLV
ncbi:MAG: AarF/UbiB family protein, partial [Bdellovibrionia bacterium]